MKKWIAFLIFSLFFGLIISAQTGDSLDIDQLQFKDFEKRNQEEKTPELKRTQFNMMVGTSFSHSPSNYYGPSVFAAPSLSYKVSPRFILRTGLMLEQTSVFPLYEREENNSEFLPMTRAYLFAQGSYLLSPKLTVSGTIIKSINDVPRLTEYSQPRNFNADIMEFGVEYKISKSISIGFQMRMQNGGGYSYSDPFFPTGSYYPFY